MFTNHRCFKTDSDALSFPFPFLFFHLHCNHLGVKKIKTNCKFWGRIGGRSLTASCLPLSKTYYLHLCKFLEIKNEQAVELLGGGSLIIDERPRCPTTARARKKREGKKFRFSSRFKTLFFLQKEIEKAAIQPRTEER